jgi:processed acidic surface protein
MNFFILQIIPRNLLYGMENYVLKLTSWIILLSTLLTFPILTQAVSLDQEVKNHLDRIGWTQDDLEEYLSLHDLILEDVQTAEDILKLLGTPINESNISALLSRYKLTQQDLDELLNQVGEQVEEYTFIEDLNIAVSYYIEHAEDLAGLANFFSYIGLSDAEVSNLYRHITSLDQQSLYDRIIEINKQVDLVQPVEQPKQLTNEQKHQLFPIFNEVLSMYQLSPTYHIDSDTTVITTSHDLPELEQLYRKNLRIELYDHMGKLVGDISLSSEMLSSDLILQINQQLLRIGKTKQSISQQVYESGSLNTTQAQPYTLNLFYGLILLVGSTIWYLFSMNRVKR